MLIVADLGDLDGGEAQARGNVLGLQNGAVDLAARRPLEPT
jgi:hypothetical protein